MKKSPAKKYNLICVAHPDDETLFFAGLIQRHTKYPWHIICLTDGNADGMGLKRKRDFKKACKKLGVKEIHWWGYADLYEKRLPIEEITHKLKEIPLPHKIFTHGPLGEYGHPHHQDTCLAVHRAFADHVDVYSVSYNSFPELLIKLSASEFAVKTKILSTIYASESNRFLNLLPATFCEGFQKLNLSEVENLYQYFCSTDESKKLSSRSLKKFKWLIPFLYQHKGMPRPF